MTGPRRRRSTALATLVVVALVGGALLAFAPTAVADPHGNGSSGYAITQGEQCIEVTPIVDESQSVEEFYDYRSNETEQTGDFSSYGTEQYQEDNTSTLLLYTGPNGTSLVVVHEQHHDNAQDGSPGGFATFDLSGLPMDGEWVVQDDDYTGQDDIFSEDGSTVNWGWGQGRTDGGAFRGLTGDVELLIDPTFNDGSDHPVDPESSPSYDGTVDGWDVVTGHGNGTEVPLDSLSEQVAIDGGYCTPPNASISVSNDTPEAGQSVTLNASNATSAAPVTEYRWDFDDETAEVTRTSPVINHTFRRAESHTVTVTVDDGYESDTASMTVNVTDEMAPTARIDTNGTVAATKPLEFSANGSEDNGLITDYEWNFGDGEEENGENVTNTYTEAGEYDVQLTVTDSAGNTNSTNRTVTVTEPPDPVASLVAPDAATVNETVTLDASGPEPGPNASYSWSIDGTAINATEPTVDYAFSSPDSYNVSVTVSDDYGNDTNATTIEVFPPPVAQIDANRTTVEVGEAIAFDGSASAGNVVDYEWTVNDDSISSNETAVHTFEEVGNHTVALTVGDAADNANTTTMSVTVVEAGNGTDDDNGSDDSDGSDESDSGDAGSGSSGGGGSGGYAPPQPAPDPVESSVELDNGTIVVTVENARAHESVSVDVPTGTGVESTIGTTAVQLRSLEIRPAHDADDMTVRVEPADRAVPGRFVAPAAYVPNATTELADVTYEFAIDPNATAAAGVSTENLTAYAGGEEWAAVDTDVDGDSADGGDIVASATVDGGAPVGLGGVGSALLVTGVETAGLAADGTVELAVTALNTGDAPGEWTVPIEAGGVVGQEASIALGPGEEATETATVDVGAMTDAANGTGGTSVTVAGIRRDLAVVSVTSLELSLAEPAPNESVTIEATLRNRGSAAGEVDATLRLDGDPVATETVLLDAGQRTTVQFDHAFANEGRYELAVGNATASVDVEPRDSFDDEEQQTNDATPGFGAVGALAAVGAILAALAVAGRLRNRP